MTKAIMSHQSLHVVVVSLHPPRRRPVRQAPAYPLRMELLTWHVTVGTAGQAILRQRSLLILVCDLSGCRMMMHVRTRKWRLYRFSLCMPPLLVLVTVPPSLVMPLKLV